MGEGAACRPGGAAMPPDADRCTSDVWRLGASQEQTAAAPCGAIAYQETNLTSGIQ